MSVIDSRLQSLDLQVKQKSGLTNFPPPQRTTLPGCSSPQVGQFCKTLESELGFHVMRVLFEETNRTALPHP